MLKGLKNTRTKRKASYTESTNFTLGPDATQTEIHKHSVQIRHMHSLVINVLHVYAIFYLVLLNGIVIKMFQS